MSTQRFSLSENDTRAVPSSTSLNAIAKCREWLSPDIVQLRNEQAKIRSIKADLLEHAQQDMREQMTSNQLDDEPEGEGQVARDEFDVGSNSSSNSIPPTPPTRKQAITTPALSKSELRDCKVDDKTRVARSHPEGKYSTQFQVTTENRSKSDSSHTESNVKRSTIKAVSKSRQIEVRESQDDVEGSTDGEEDRAEKGTTDPEMNKKPTQQIVQIDLTKDDSVPMMTVSGGLLKDRDRSRSPLSYQSKEGGERKIKDAVKARAEQKGALVASATAEPEDTDETRDISQSLLTLPTQTSNDASRVVELNQPEAESEISPTY